MCEHDYSFVYSIFPVKIDSFPSFTAVNKLEKAPCFVCIDVTFLHIGCEGEGESGEYAIQWLST